METDAELKIQLHKDFLSEVRRFVGEKQLPINAWEFIHVTSEAYHHWKRNPH